MNKYDELFDEATSATSVFAEKGALDPLAEPAEVVARDEQERKLAAILTGVDEGYLPTTVSVYGPPGTGKTLTVRRVCSEFAERREEFEFAYVNLKECRTVFSAANEILFELAGEKRGAYEGLDGVFDAIWTALEAYPEWTVLVLDEIDQVRHDSNYDPSDFFYRLLRGEGRLKRGLNLSVILVSNELVEVDLRVDSRVRSAMSGEEVFFPPYDFHTLLEVMLPRLGRAFEPGVLTEDGVIHGISHSATRWGDARKALTLFRRAGEYANEHGLDKVTVECIEANLEGTEREAIMEKLLSLPVQYFFVLRAMTSWSDRLSGDIVQPVSTAKVEESYNLQVSESSRIGTRAIRDVISDLETMGLVDTWVESRGSEGRSKRIQTMFDPEWVEKAADRYFEEHEAVRFGPS